MISGRADGGVRIWSAPNGQRRHTLRGHEGRVWSVAFSPDETLLASGGADSSIYLWDTFTGLSSSSQVAVAGDWLRRHAQDEAWFLHVNFWDVHVPYRAPAPIGDPFAGEPLPAWYTENVLHQHLEHSYGPNSAHHGIVWRNGHSRYEGVYPRQPVRFDSMQQARRMFDGYDTAIRYVDQAIARILDELDRLGLLDETAIVLSADHGENLGELNIYMDHATADQATMRVPLIVRWPGLPGGRVDRALRYQVDLAATVVELVGGHPPENWDGETFAADLWTQQENGRDFLMLSQLSHSCQRAVRFDDFLYLRSYHDAYRCLPEELLFNVVADPHEQQDLANHQPDLVQRAKAMLLNWEQAMARTTTYPDPLGTVLAEGGGYHARHALPSLIDWLVQHGRTANAKQMRTRYGAHMD
jgi:choline-sulfatase